MELEDDSTFSHLREILHQREFIDSAKQNEWKFEAENGDFSGVENMKGAPKLAKGCIKVIEQKQTKNVGVCENNRCSYIHVSNIETLTLAAFREKLPSKFEAKPDCEDWRFVRNQEEEITTGDLIGLVSEKDILLKTLLDPNSDNIKIINFYEVDLKNVKVYTGIATYKVKINPFMKLDSFRRLLSKKVICRNKSKMALPSSKVLDTSNGEAWRVIDRMYDTSKIRSIQQEYKIHPDLGLAESAEQSVTVSQKLYVTKEKEIYIDYSDVNSNSVEFVGMRAQNFENHNVTVSVPKRYDNDEYLQPVMLSYLRSINKNGIFWDDILIAENNTPIIIYTCQDSEVGFEVYVSDGEKSSFGGNCKSKCCAVSSYDDGRHIHVISQNTVEKSRDMILKKMSITVSVTPVYKWGKNKRSAPSPVLENSEEEAEMRNLISVPLLITKANERIPGDSVGPGGFEGGKQKDSKSYSDVHSVEKGALVELKFEIFTFRSRAIADKLLRVVPEASFSMI